MSNKVTLKPKREPVKAVKLTAGDLVEITYGNGTPRIGLIHFRQFTPGVTQVTPAPLHVIYLDHAGWDALKTITSNPSYYKVRKLEKGDVVSLEAR